MEDKSGLKQLKQDSCKKDRVIIGSVSFFDMSVIREFLSLKVGDIVV